MERLTWAQNALSSPELLERMVSEARERLSWAQNALNSPDPVRTAIPTESLEDSSST